MVYLFYLSLCLIPGLIGGGVMLLLYGKKYENRISVSDCLICGWMILFGLAEATQIYVCAFGRSFCDFTKLFSAGVLILTLLGVLAGLPIALYRMKQKKNRRLLQQQATENAEIDGDFKTQVRAHQGFFGIACIWLVTLLLIAIYLYFLQTKDTLVSGYDMTLETVQSFLYTDQIFSVNPLTGDVYDLGMPTRLKLLALPSLYGAMSQSFSIDPVLLIRQLLPAFFYLLALISYAGLGRALFEREAYQFAIYELCVVLLFFLGGTQYGIEGFDLFYCGVTGAAIRNSIILPQLIGACIRGRKLYAVLCVLAEACIVWTLYGAGLGVLMIAGMFLAFLFGKWKTGREQEVHE